ncbi:T9SS type A sorting domain-containing protein [Paracrocinitomix mangrovi]|uniref:T9SS type A sorting domain-containing protein n=1 Tax=Paracrocinitomix mangrovi TaxID=2862509 RepID=UPI001C8E0FC8|nr:T9SS type A sorting domain-containing protein [Paracrocinitomix mangrovi]UKN01048.1 T9SS type A sorting domain-containing protein [Paracrocinitomix mangrovi]
MKNLYALVGSLLISATLFAQTTEYTTGQTYGDGWTGWSTPVTSNVTSSSVNGIYLYTFNGNTSDSYTIEMYRQFDINSNDIDIYLNATCENATVSIEHSTDGVSYTQIGSGTWGSGFSMSSVIVPTFDPQVSNFYLKLKIAGTFGSPGQAVFNNLKIDAVVNTGASIGASFELNNRMVFSQDILKVIDPIGEYQVEVFNINGQRVHFESNLTEMSTADFVQGIYFAALTTKEGRRKTIKIVKQ